MKQAKNSSYRLYQFFLVLVLFLPTTNFFLFYGVTFFCALLLFIYYPISLKSFYISMGILSLLIFFSLSRVVFFGNSEDLKEGIKFIIAFLLIMIPCSLNLISVLNLLFFFTAFNFIVAFCQFNHLDPFSFISTLNNHYVAEHHISASLSYFIPRAIGISSGPGQQAVLNVFIASVFFASLQWVKVNRKKYWLGLGLAVLSVFMSQSKTAILALPIGVVIFAIISARKFGAVRTLWLWFYLLCAGSGLFFIWEWLVFNIPEINRLMEGGLAVSSFQDRLGNWRAVTSPMHSDSQFFALLFGLGRSGLEYFGVNNIPYDSDYIYFYVNFGMIGLLVFMGVLLYFLIIVFLSSNITPRRLLFSLICAFSMVISSSLNFYIEPRVYILTAVLFSCYNLMVGGYEERFEK